MNPKQAELKKIYDRTSGYCHLCHKKLALTNYGIVGSRGAWEVDHSVARARGGTDHGNNLYACCIPCNRAKGTLNSRRIRKENGKKRVPLSSLKRSEARVSNAAGGAILGGIVGSIMGPIGAIVGAAFGAKVGMSQNPDA